MHLFKADGEHDSRGSKLSGRGSPPGHHCWSQGDGPGTTTRRARRTRSMLRLVDLIRSCFCFLSPKLHSYLISFNYIISDYFTAAQCVVNSLLPGCLLMRNSDLCTMQQDLFVERQVKNMFHCNCCSVEFVDNLQFHQDRRSKRCKSLPECSGSTGDITPILCTRCRQCFPHFLYFWEHWTSQGLRL